jgi:aspartate racemase
VRREVRADRAAQGARAVAVDHEQDVALGGHKIECVRSDAADREAIDRLIMEELVRDVVTPKAIAMMQGAVARLAEVGCDAVVLGCTELPLVLDDERSPLPTLDSTRLLARAALAHASSPPR